MEVRYGIQISSYGESVWNSVHFYGRAWRYDGDTIVSEDLEHELTSAAAQRLNKHDSDIMIAGFRWRVGSKTNRFESEDDVIAAGMGYLVNLYGPFLKIVERGDPSGLENPVLYVKES